MPLQATSGAASYDAFGGGVAAVPNYIEDVFSTYLYTGNGSSQTITNGIDLSTKGGMVWAKRRDSAINHGLWSTTSAGNFLISNATTANTALATGVTAFSTTGFSLGSGYFNTSAGTYTSWSFKQQAKFFTQVTFTGTGSTQTIAHDLGSTPAFIIVKRTDTTSNWACYHTSLGATQNIALNSTAAAASSSYWDNTSPTSTVFTVGGSFSDVNASGGTYIAYLFAHDAGGFGLTGTDNVISCGSFLTDSGGNATVTLGYEPQFVMWKASSTTGGWNMLDTMRGFTVGGSDALLSANSTSAETSIDLGSPTATGFTAAVAGTNATYIYIAIRRGPMKVPTSGTEVFAPVARTATQATAIVTAGFTPDMLWGKRRTSTQQTLDWDRLRGVGQNLILPSTAAESSGGAGVQLLSFNMDGLTLGSDSGFDQINGPSGATVANWIFKRAPSFFDEVCYTGTGSAQNITHNLGVAPELIITKDRSGANSWGVGSTALGGWGDDKYLTLNTDRYVNYSGSLNCWNSTAPTSSVFTVGTFPYTNQSGRNYVAYLFATCPGVSKVGSYTGTGSTQTISCGFTGGARFVLIKRIDSTGNWWVWDTARGMTSGNDPELFLNLTIGEDYNENVYTTTGGFQIVSTASGINASGGSYIYLAIA